MIRWRCGFSRGCGTSCKTTPSTLAVTWRWSQRVFRRCTDDSIKSFDDFFGGRDPKLMRLWINTARFLTSERVRPAWQRVSVPAEAAL